MLSIPFADDFSCATETLMYVQEKGNYLSGALYGTRRYWMEFQGSYTGIFFMLYLNAFARWGLVGLRLFNAACMLAFFVSLYVLTDRFVKDSEHNSVSTMAIFFIVLFWNTNNYIYSEVYTWNNVIVIYIIPFIFLFLGEAFYLDYLREQNHAWLTAAFLGIAIGGGTINIATLGCGLYLLTAIYGILQNRVKNKFKLVLPVIIAIISTLANVLAPGNFIRWGDGSRVNPLSVFETSFLNIIKRFWQLCIGTPFIVLVMIMLILVYKWARYSFDEKLTYKHPIMFALLLIFGATLVDFPYALGIKAQSVDTVFEDRALFVQDITIYILMTLWVFYFAGYLRAKWPQLEFGKSHGVLIALTLCANILLLIGGGKIFELTTPYMIQSIINGSAHDYSDYQEEIMEMVEHGDDDVVIWYDSNRCPPKDRIILGLRLGDDEERWDYWRNTAMANFYKKKSVKVIYDD